MSASRLGRTQDSTIKTATKGFPNVSVNFRNSPVAEPPRYNAHVLSVAGAISLENRNNGRVVGRGSHSPPPSRSVPHGRGWGKPL